MKPDLYTEAILTIIAFPLFPIARGPLMSPETTASAQGPFAGVHFATEERSVSFFDGRAGEFRGYNRYDGQVRQGYRVTKLGEPVVRAK
jgi:hypothetical protein